MPSSIVPESAAYALFFDESGLFCENSTNDKERLKNSESVGFKGVREQRQAFPSMLAGVLVRAVSIEGHQAEKLLQTAHDVAGIELEAKVHASEQREKYTLSPQFDLLIQALLTELKRVKWQPVRIVNKQGICYGDARANYLNVAAEFVWRIVEKLEKDHGRSGFVLNVFPSSWSQKATDLRLSGNVTDGEIGLRIQERLGQQGRFTLKEQSRVRVASLLKSGDRRQQICDLLSNASCDDFGKLGREAKNDYRNALGDFNFTMQSQAPLDLSNWIQDFDTTSILPELDDFIGREFLRDEVETFLRTHSRGMLVIEGQPGRGKSAFLVHLLQKHWAQRRPRPVSYFYCRTANRTNPEACLRHLYASLLEEFQIQETDPETRKLDASSLQNRLEKTLKEISRRLEGTNQKLIIVIDALDEAGSPGGKREGIEALPRNLPDGVFLIVTTRPGHGLMGWNQLINLEDAKKYNEGLRKDVLRYVERQTLTQSLSAEARREIAHLSDGNFLVAYVACKHIRDNLNLSPEEVPAFLRKLAQAESSDRLGITYAEFWGRLQVPFSDEEFSSIDKVAAALITARTAVTANMLGEVCQLGRKAWAQVETKLSELLDRSHCYPPHADVIEGDNWDPEVVYRLYHESFADFLRRKLTLTEQQEAEEAWAKFSLKHWEDKKPGLSQEYALRFAPSHLADANSGENLIQLLTRLSFIVAKCRAGMTFELVQDYATARNSLPRFREEQKRDQRLADWVKGLVNYSAVWSERRRQAGETGDYDLLSDVSAVPLPVLPGTKDVIAEMRLAKPAAGRALSGLQEDRLLAFETFVSLHASFLHEHPEAILPQAYNYAADGPVVEQAEKLLRKSDRIWLKCEQRPPAPPLRPLIRRRIVASDYLGGGRTRFATPDLKYVVADADSSTHVYDLVVGRQIADLRGERMLALTPDGRTALTTDAFSPDAGQMSGEVRVWNMLTGEVIGRLRGHEGFLRGGSITHDGARAVIWGEGQFYCWELAPSELVCDGSYSEEGIHGIFLSPTGTRCLFTGKTSPLFRVWNLETRQWEWDSDDEPPQCHSYWPAAHLPPTTWPKLVTPDKRIECEWDRDSRTLSVYSHLDGRKEALRTFPFPYVSSNDDYDFWLSADGRTAVLAVERVMILVDLERGESSRDVSESSDNTTNREWLHRAYSRRYPMSRSGDGTLRIERLQPTTLTSVSAGEPFSEKLLAILSIDHPENAAEVVEPAEALSSDGALLIAGTSPTPFRNFNDPLRNHPERTTEQNLPFSIPLQIIRYAAQPVFTPTRPAILVPQISTPSQGELECASLPDGTFLWGNETLTYTFRQGRWKRIEAMHVRGLGDRVATCTADGRYLFYNDSHYGPDLVRLRDGKVKKFRSSTACVHECVISADARWVIWCEAASQQVFIWDLREDRLCGRYLLPDERFENVRDVDVNGNVLFSGTCHGAAVAQLMNLPRIVPWVTGMRIFKYALNQEKLAAASELGWSGFRNSGEIPAYVGRTIPGRFDSEITILCPKCEHRSPLPAKIREIIDAIHRRHELGPADSPCLNLPDAAWDREPLDFNCPNPDCNWKLRSNPFYVDNRVWLSGLESSDSK